MGGRPGRAHPTSGRPSTCACSDAPCVAASAVAAHAGWRRALPCACATLGRRRDAAGIRGDIGQCAGGGLFRSAMRACRPLLCPCGGSSQASRHCPSSPPRPHAWPPDGRQRSCSTRNGSMRRAAARAGLEPPPLPGGGGRGGACTQPLHAQDLNRLPSLPAEPACARRRPCKAACPAGLAKARVGPARAPSRPLQNRPAGALPARCRAVRGSFSRLCASAAGAQPRGRETRRRARHS